LSVFSFEKANNTTTHPDRSQVEPSPNQKHFFSSRRTFRLLLIAALKERQSRQPIRLSNSSDVYSRPIILILTRILRVLPFYSRYKPNQLWIFIVCRAHCKAASKFDELLGPYSSCRSSNAYRFRNSDFLLQILIAHPMSAISLRRCPEAFLMASGAWYRRYLEMPTRGVADDTPS
jgi:hypothetical protein